MVRGTMKSKAGKGAKPSVGWQVLFFHGLLREDLSGDI